jgi:hypothetical protein
MIKEAITGIINFGKNLSSIETTESPICQNFEMAAGKARRHLMEQ